MSGPQYIPLVAPLQWKWKCKTTNNLLFSNKVKNEPCHSYISTHECMIMTTSCLDHASRLLGQTVAGCCYQLLLVMLSHKVVMMLTPDFIYTAPLFQKAQGHIHFGISHETLPCLHWKIL